MLEDSFAWISYYCRAACCLMLCCLRSVKGKIRLVLVNLEMPICLKLKLKITTRPQFLIRGIVKASNWRFLLIDHSIIAMLGC